MKRFLRFVGIAVAALFILLLAAVAILHWYPAKIPTAPFLPPKPVSGAAVFYNRAFALLPEFSAEEKKLLGAKLDQPVDTTMAAALVEKCVPSLKLVEQGAVEKECEWGLDLNRGFAMSMPHVGKGLSSLQLLKLRARLNFENGNKAVAAEDVLRMFRLGRHLQEPGLLIGDLVRISGDTMTIGFAARHLAEFDEESLKKLSEGIAALPPVLPLQKVMALDNQGGAISLYGWIAKVLASKQGDKAKLKELHDEFFTEIIGGFEKFIRFSPALSCYLVHRLELRAQEMQELMGLPYPEARPKLKAFEESLKKMTILDILAKLALPAVSGVVHKEMQTATMMEILRTALDAQLHDPASVRGELAKLRDPYDGGPIEMRDVPGGVEIQLKSDPGKKQPTLMVGLAGK